MKWNREASETTWNRHKQKYHNLFIKKKVLIKKKVFKWKKTVNLNDVLMTLVVLQIKQRHRNDTVECVNENNNNLNWNM